MVALAPIPLLPELPPEDAALLTRLLALKEDLYALSKETSRPLLDLFAWCSRPDIAAYLRFHRELLSHLQTQSALSALQAIVDSTECPVERRRAASAMLRILKPSRPSGPRKDPADPDLSERADLQDDQDLDEDDDSPDPDDPFSASALAPPPGEVPASSRAEGALSSNSPTQPPRATTQANSAASNRSSSPSQRLTVSPPPPPPPSIPEVFHRPGGIPIPEGLPLPDPSRSPEAVFALILHHLKNPDSPVPGAGHHALLNLSAWGGPRTQEHLETEVWRWRNLLPLAVGHESATPEGPPIRNDRWLTQVFRVQKAGSSAQISLSLQRLDLGALKGCWILGQYKTLDPPPAAAPAPKPRVAARFNTG